MTTQTEALDMIAKIQFAHQAMEAACERIDQLKAENKALKEALAQPEQESVAWEHHAKKLTQWLRCMSYNDSYFGEPAGLVKQVTGELNRLIGTSPLPAPVQQEPVGHFVLMDGRWMQCNEKAEYTTALYAEALQPKEPEQEPVAWKKLHEWMVRNMPSGTIISDPSWWAHHIYIRFIRDATQPQRKTLTDEMVTAAARVLNERQADACGVDRDDQWAIYSDDFKADARAMLEAAHGIKE